MGVFALGILSEKIPNVEKRYRERPGGTPLSEYGFCTLLLYWVCFSEATTFSGKNGWRKSQILVMKRGRILVSGVYGSADDPGPQMIRMLDRK